VNFARQNFCVFNVFRSLQGRRGVLLYIHSLSNFLDTQLISLSHNPLADCVQNFCAAVCRFFISAAVAAAARFCHFSRAACGMLKKDSG